MHRIDAPGATAQNRFTQGDAVQGIPATVVDDEWLNAVQEEVVTVIDEASIALDKTKHNQLFLAIQKMVQITATQLDDKRWPVGSVYANVEDVTDPGTFLPGNWTRMTSGFLYPQGATDSGVIGATGGATSVSIQKKHLPNIRIEGRTKSAGQHSHPYVYTYATTAYDGTSTGPTGIAHRTENTGASGEHAHDFKTDVIGDGVSLDNMPPHVTVYMWKRVS